MPEKMQSGVVILMWGGCVKSPGPGAAQFESKVSLL